MQATVIGMSVLISVLAMALRFYSIQKRIARTSGELIGLKGSELNRFVHYRVFRCVLARQYKEFVGELDVVQFMQLGYICQQFKRRQPVTTDGLDLAAKEGVELARAVIKTNHEL